MSRAQRAILIKTKTGGNMQPPENFEAVREALLARGNVFTNGDEPGVKPGS